MNEARTTERAATQARRMAWSARVEEVMAVMKSMSAATLHDPASQKSTAAQAAVELRRIADALDQNV